MNEKSTEELTHEIKDATDIEDYMQRNRRQMITQDLPEYLHELLNARNLKRADIVRDAHIDRPYLYQIFSGKKKPSRDKLIAIAFGMRLSAEETQKMLRISGGRELYARIERDALILFALHQNRSLFEANKLLCEHNCQPII